MTNSLKNKNKAIKELIEKPLTDRTDLMREKRKISKKYSISLLQNSDILKYVKNQKKIKKNSNLIELLKKRAIRTMSGIAPVAILTKAYPCPGECAYCPSEKNVPKSYLSNEPAVMRAIRCKYDPYKQVQLRLKALEANGHNPEKIELIVIGGTWSVLPKKYKYNYIKEAFRGANDYPKDKKSKKENLKEVKKALAFEQKKNEKTRYKIIGLTLETRPDYINEKEIKEMREFGCTRVELGIQAVDDKILKLNKRGHDVKEIARATKLLKNNGYKITYHFMPALPGSTPKKDFLMYKKLFEDERFCPDQIKFYPCVVTKGSLLYEWWKKKKYKPYTEKQLENLIIKCKKITPEYVRIIRLIRDIPGESIEAGNKITNLRQIIKNKGVQCNCIRCREAGDLKFSNNDFRLNVKEYKASAGKEFFISADSKDKKTLYGFCRLRLPNYKANEEKTAFIRELHVYGRLIPAGGKGEVQHKGIGKLLMQKAEDIVKENNYENIAVISGIGVRGYYRKLGYRLKNTYMVK
jgi:elongator complex protein 3